MESIVPYLSVHEGSLAEVGCQPTWTFSGTQPRLWELEDYGAHSPLSLVANRPRDHCATLKGAVPGRGSWEKRHLWYGSTDWKIALHKHPQTVTLLWRDIKFQLAIGENFLFIQGNSFSTRRSIQFWCFPMQTATKGVKWGERKKHINHILFKISQARWRARPHLERCTSVRFFLCLKHTVSQHLTCVAWCQVDLHVSACTCRMLTTEVMTLWQRAGLACPLACHRRSNIAGTSPGDIPTHMHSPKLRSSQVPLFAWNNCNRPQKAIATSKYILRPQLCHSAQRSQNKKCRARSSPPRGSKPTPFLLTTYKKQSQDCCTSNRDARDLHWETCKKARRFCRRRGFFGS